MKDLEQTIMALICYAGEARSYAMSAIKQARQCNWAGAEEALNLSKKVANTAHRIQAELIFTDEGVGKVSVNLILVHAQDHLMTAILCQDLAEEIVLLRKELFAK